MGLKVFFIAVTLLGSAAWTAQAAALWFVPSSEAGTVSEALQLAGADDTILVTSAYSPQFSRAVGQGIPAGTPEQYPLRITQAGLILLCIQGPSGWATTQDRAVMVIEAERVGVVGCWFEAGGVGLVAIQANRLQLSSNRFGPADPLEPLLEGVRLIQVQDGLVENNRFEGLEGVALHLEASGNNQLQNNQVQACGQALLLLDASDNTFTKELYQDNRAGGVQVEAGRDNQFSDLQLLDNAGGGMLLVEAAGIRVSHSQIARNQGPGLVWAGGEPPTLEAVRLEGNGQDEPVQVPAEQLQLLTPLLQAQPSELPPQQDLGQQVDQLRQKIQALPSQLALLDDQLRWLGEELAPQTASARLSLRARVENTLAAQRSITQGTLPEVLAPLRREVDTDLTDLAAQLADSSDPLLVEAQGFLERLQALWAAVGGQFDALQRTLDDGQREADFAQFDDATDWLQFVLDVLDGKLPLVDNAPSVDEAVQRAGSALEAGRLIVGTALQRWQEVQPELLGLKALFPQPPPAGFQLLGNQSVAREVIFAGRWQERQVEAEVSRALSSLAVDPQLQALSEQAHLPINDGSLRALTQEVGLDAGATGGPWLQRLEFGRLVSVRCPGGLLPAAPCLSGQPPQAIVVWLPRFERLEPASVARASFPSEGRAPFSVTAESGSPSQLVFRPAGAAASAWRVQLFDLAGRRVWDSGWRRQAAIRWNLRGVQGERLANGVYLYWASARGAGGSVRRGKLQKLVLLR